MTGHWRKFIRTASDALTSGNIYDENRALDGFGAFRSIFSERPFVPDKHDSGTCAPLRDVQVLTRYCAHEALTKITKKCCEEREEDFLSILRFHY